MIVAGIGVRSACTAEAVVDLVAEASRRCGAAPDHLAAPDFKGHEPGLQEAARRLGLHLVLIERAALVEAQPHCVTRSATALAATGLASVAEAAALAAAGPGATLLLSRISGPGVTCAVASGDAP